MQWLHKAANVKSSQIFVALAVHVVNTHTSRTYFYNFLWHIIWEKYRGLTYMHSY